MREGLQKFKQNLKNGKFAVFAFLALLLPDLMIRFMQRPSVFSEGYVDFVSLGFSLLWIAVILFFCIFVLPPKTGRAVFGAAGGIIIIYTFCQYVYFKIFNQFFWIKSIFLAGEGADYLGFAVKYVDAWLVSFTAAAVCFLVIAVIKWQGKRLHFKWWALLLLPILGIAALHICLSPELFNESQDDWDSWSKPRVVYKNFSDANKSLDICGAYHFIIRDLYTTVFPQNQFGEEDYETVDGFFAEKGAPKENEYTGMFKGKNVIAVMLESVDTWMIDEKYTPTICYMMKNGINLTNYYAPTFGTGHTLNSEFAFNTGYFNPITSVSSVNFVSNRFPYSMANLFKNAGYTTNSFHYNTSEFYNRGILHHSLGFEAYNSFPDFGMPVTVSQADSNVMKNDAIYKKMTEDTPFFDFVISYSGHVPYTFDDAKLAVAKENHPELIDPNMDKETNNCMLLARDTDDFFRLLLKRLEEDGILEDTVIIGFADHYNYGFSDQKLLEEYKEGEILYKVPAFIYLHGGVPKEVKTPAQTIDFLPTIANLFDLEAPNCYIGGDFLDESREGFVYFGNRGWLDEELYYVPSEETPAEEDLEHIQKQNALVTRLMNINDIVISGDYFAHNR